MGSLRHKYPNLEVKNENALVPSGWREFKFFTDLGSLAGKIFDMRLKNADVSTLQELSEAAKAIRIEVRNEFGLQLSSN